MGEPIVCPNCGEEDSIDIKHDAWARFQLVGVSSKGRLIKGREFDTNVFQYHEIECTSCGATFEESEMVSYLQTGKAPPNMRRNDE